MRQMVRNLESLKLEKNLYFAKLLSIFILFSTLIFLIQLCTPGFVGVDAYYHVKVSELMMEQGIFDRFPWTQTSIWKDRYADKEFLFHLYLIPFIGIFPNLMIAGKVAIAVLVGILFSFIYRLLNQFQVQHPFIWTLVAFGVNFGFLQRICMVRPHVLSLLLVLLFVESLWKQQRWRILLISLIYPLAYTAAHFLILIAIIYVAVLWIHQKQFKISFLGLTLAGIAVGLVIHPQFPNNLKTWYVQNALLPVFNFGKRQEFWFVTEVKSLPIWAFIGANGITLFLFGVAMALLILNRRKLSHLFLFIFSLASIFMGMTIFSIRFVEYWVPFSVLACALSLKVLEPVKLPVLKTGFRVGHFALISLTILTYVLVMLLVPIPLTPELEEAAHWLKTNARQKSVIFTTNWSDFPQLFYFNTQNYYLFGLDPVYCYAYDPDVWHHWIAIVSGEVEEPSKEIREVFGVSYVLCTKDSKETEYALTKQLLQTDQSHIRYEDKRYLIFSLE